MGGEMLIPLLMAGGGTALQMMANNEAAGEKRSILNRQLERDAQATDRATQMVQQEGQRYGQDQRMQGLQQQEAKAFDQTQTDLQGAGGANVATSSQAGNVSDDFLKSKAARAITEGTRLTSIAREAAKSRAPGMLGQEDALSRANMAGGLQDLWGTNTNMARANSLDAESVQPPEYGALGGIASAIGTSMAGNALSKGAGVSWDPDGSFGRKYGRGMGF